MFNFNAEYVYDEVLLFVTEATFSGNGQFNDEGFTCRFAITKMKTSGKLIVHPEILNKENGSWKPARPASWVLDTVLDSQGLYLDFGSSQTIKPTPEVWQEIRNRLHEHKTA